MTNSVETVNPSPSSSKKYPASEQRCGGASIVGYGEYHYKYESGREGDSTRIGFSPRKGNISIYIMPGYTNYDPILESLGKHKKGKSCLYIKRLSDVDLEVLKRLLVAGWKDMEKLYPE